MEQNKTKAKMGRPKIEIDQCEFEKLCAMQCTLIEISEWFGVSEDTIERWCKRTYKATFADTFKRKSAGGRISLRRKQFEVAMAGDKTLLVWLGKNWLGQRDIQEVYAEAGESTIEQIAKMIMDDKKNVDSN